MKHFSSAALVAALMLHFASVSALEAIQLQTRDEAPRSNDLSEVILPILRKADLPALGAAIVTSDGIEAMGAVGLRSWKSTEAVTIDDQWHIGSCTKTMTATLAARLIERGLLSWDTTIGSVLGPTIHPDWKDVTVAWLLCHRSGAPLNFDEAIWEQMVARGGSPQNQRRYFVEQGLKSPPTTTPNTETVYSNSAYIVVGVMMETLADSSWEDLMRREIFEPLGMDRTGFGAPGEPGKLNQPLGHVTGVNGWTPIALGPHADNPAATGPAGSVHTTLSDWARFVATHLRGARGDESYLSATNWQRLHSASESGWDYTPGWKIGKQEWAGGKFLRHIGGNGFWLAEASLVPNKDFAVLIVTNTSDDSVETPFKELLDALVAARKTHGK